MPRWIIILAVFAAAWFFNKGYTDTDGAADDEEAAIIQQWQKAERINANNPYAQDGDSIIAGRRHIRLLCIDAPEKDQPHGAQAKAFLAKLIKNGADIRTKGKDQYGRALAVVIITKDNKKTIANYEMLKEGHAWVYKKFATTCGLPKQQLQKLQQKAQQTKKGLWQQKNPTPPWQWRHKNQK